MSWQLWPQPPWSRPRWTDGVPDQQCALHCPCRLLLGVPHGLKAALAVLQGCYRAPYLMVSPLWVPVHDPDQWGPQFQTEFCDSAASTPSCMNWLTPSPPRKRGSWSSRQGHEGPPDQDKAFLLWGQPLHLALHLQHFWYGIHNWDPHFSAVPYSLPYWSLQCSNPSPLNLVEMSRKTSCIP